VPDPERAETPEQQIRRLYEESEKQTAEAMERLVNQPSFGRVLALMTENVHSPEFKAKLDGAFALGREEISTAAGLMQGRFLQRNFVGAEDSPAYKAIGEIRGLLDELNPGKEGDLTMNAVLTAGVSYFQSPNAGGIGARAEVLTGDYVTCIQRDHWAAAGQPDGPRAL